MEQTNTFTDVQLTPNFKLSEFTCHDGTPVPKELFPNVLLLATNLQILRDFLGKPIHINSGYRTPAYNAKLEGAAVSSQHLQAKAADIVVAGYTPFQLKCIIEQLITQQRMKQGGIGLYSKFLHYDVRGTHARWEHVLNPTINSNQNS